jgi:hypothetical protein
MGVVFAAIETVLWLWVPAPTPNNAMKLLQKRRIPEETIRALILRIDETPMPPTSTM